MGAKMFIGNEVSSEVGAASADISALSHSRHPGTLRSPHHLASTTHHLHLLSTMFPFQAANDNRTYDSPDLQTLLHTLQTTSDFNTFARHTAPASPSFHAFFLKHLPLLLTPRRADAIHNLRLEYIRIRHLISFVERSLRSRYINFGKALLWELDHADHLILSRGDAAQFEIMNSVRTVFHLVASLCYREWGIDPASVQDSCQIPGPSSYDTVPSVQDPVYYPPPRIESTSHGPSVVSGDVSEHLGNQQQVVASIQHCDQNAIQFVPDSASDDRMPESAVHPRSNESPVHQVCETITFTENIHSRLSAHLSGQENDNVEQPQRSSDYIFHDGKRIMPNAYMQETKDGCHVPFELSVQRNSDDEFLRFSELGTCSVRVTYPDNTCVSFIPVQNIRVYNHRDTNGFTEQDGLIAKLVVEMSTPVYDTLVNRLKDAYLSRFPERSAAFFTNFDLQHCIAEWRTKLNIPVATDAFARIVHLLWYVEHPLLEALEKCGHDVLGCGFFEVEFMEEPEGTRMMISLVGVVVERNLLNYGEKIFELLKSGVVTEL